MSHKFRAVLEEYRLKQSTSHCGQCWDNAALEQIFGALKSEWMPAAGYEPEAEAKADIMDCLVRYNLKRLYSYNGYETHGSHGGKAKGSGINLNRYPKLLDQITSTNHVPWPCWIEELEARLAPLGTSPCVLPQSVSLRYAAGAS